MGVLFEILSELKFLFVVVEHDLVITIYSTTIEVLVGSRNS